MAMRLTDRTDLSLYNKKAREAYAFIKSGVFEGISGNKIQKSLSAEGFGVRREEVQEMIRVIKSGRENFRNVMPSDPNVVPQTWMLEPSMERQHKQFNVVISTVVKNQYDGNFYEYPVTIGSDYPISEAEAIFAANDISNVYGEVGEVIFDQAYMMEYNVDPWPRIRPV